ncbi:hypothetical protein [Stieleria varia]|uniref:PSP1 C-terminal domain-containing protein n=1 Tax=Stieleria varia TaxID=2528005 RepID=A0A5C5ZYS4_9BACT|nr:hypothetical protein [Stieleria varia]TWT92774.1 hypothetical protein Pla52n_61390 [Stieleria varia]
MEQYFVRVGALAQVRVAGSLLTLEHGCRVVLRSPRGLELGVVCGRSSTSPAAQSRQLADAAPGYKILRPTDASDELLIERLEQHKRDAVESCRRALAEAGSQAVLLDVDQMINGGALVMHFLGDVDAIAERISAQIAACYEETVRSDHFAKLLQEGCGPGCGGESSGCGSGGCSGCSVAAACHG